MVCRGLVVAALRRLLAEVVVQLGRAHPGPDPGQVARLGARLGLPPEFQGAVLAPHRPQQLRLPAVVVPVLRREDPCRSTNSASTVRVRRRRYATKRSTTGPTPAYRPWSTASASAAASAPRSRSNHGSSAVAARRA